MLIKEVIGMNIPSTYVVFTSKVLFISLVFLDNLISHNKARKESILLTSTYSSLSKKAKSHSRAAFFQFDIGLIQCLVGCHEMSLFLGSNTQISNFEQNKTSKELRCAALRPSLQRMIVL